MVISRRPAGATLVLTRQTERNNNQILFLIMFGLKSKQIADQVTLAIARHIKDDVTNHWIAFADQFNLPPPEFYDLAEKEIAALKLPGLEISRKEFAEGGPLSAKRVYLRFIRERLAFDVCAAPFGTRYFFSCRTVYSPPKVKLWHFVAVVATFSAIFYGLEHVLGVNLAALAVAGLILTIFSVARNAVAMELNDLDALLMKIPAFGPIYERFFRVDTYYRQDARLMYQDTIPAVIEKLADEVTAGKGCRLVRQYQCAPILGELYKPLPPRQPEEKK